MDRRVKTSRFLSWVLRHAPQKIGLELDPAGWVSCEALIAKANEYGVHLTQAGLREIVETDKKGRYVFSADGKRIRALYGHSIAVDLALEAERPPEILYHGTARRFLHSILQKGLHPAGRQFVHLSATVEIARSVGARHGSPVVLAISAREMYEAGHAFYHAGRETWLVRSVPAEFLQVLDAKE